jgi:hypothetical protein
LIPSSISRWFARNRTLTRAAQATAQGLAQATAQTKIKKFFGYIGRQIEATQ